VKGIATPPGAHAVYRLGLDRARYGFCDDDFPGVLACNLNTMAIPLHNRMNAEDYDYVANALGGL